jgi:hypothetical protein
MRWCVALALISTLVSPSALAAGKGGKGAKKKAEDKTAVSMDSGLDPALKEQSEPGPFAPKGKTGELAENEKNEEEKKEVVKARPRDKRIVFGDFLLGFGRAPSPGPASQNLDRTPKATLFGVVAGAAFDLSKTFTLGVRVPWSTASLQRAAGTQSSMAFGSPEIVGEVRKPLSELTTLPIFFGVGAPLAQGEPDPSQTDLNAGIKADVNRLADADSGWREGELYAPKRLPLVLGVGIQYARRALEFHAYTKLAAGINVGKGTIRDPQTFGAGPQFGRLVVHALSLRNVTLAGITYDLVSKPVIWVGLDAWLVYNPIEPIQFKSGATPPTKLQLVAEPRLGARFGKLRPSFGFLLPIGGRLADTASTGLSLRVDYAF